MELLYACVAKIVTIAAISAVCEHFLEEGRAQKGFNAIVGLMTAGVIADGLMALLGK